MPNKDPKKRREYSVRYRREHQKERKMWEKNNPEKVRAFWKRYQSTPGYKEKRREWEKKNSEYRSQYRRQRLLGKKESVAPRKKPEQCEICGAFGKDLKKGLCFDHDHITGKFRGWICGRCNTTLGFIKDSTELLSAMIRYLEKRNY